MIQIKAIIFFKSKYLKQEHVIINTPNNVNVNKNVVKNCNDRQNVDNINLIKAKILSFNINPANNNEIEEFDSLCTSGNQ